MEELEDEQLLESEMGGERSRSRANRELVNRTARVGLGRNQRLPVQASPARLTDSDRLTRV